MARQTPFTAQQERLDRRIKNNEAEIEAIRTMVNPDRSLLTAQIIKVTDPTSPQIIRVSAGGSLEVGGVSGWKPVGALTEAVTHTGDTLETTLFTATVRGGSMGPNGFVRIWSMWRVDIGGGGTWRIRYRFDGSSIGTFSSSAARGLDSRLIHIWNKNDEAAQSHMSDSLALSGHVGGSSIIPLTKDTTADIPITFTAKGGNAAHVSVLHSALVEVLHRD